MLYSTAASFSVPVIVKLVSVLINFWLPQAPLIVGATGTVVSITISVFKSEATFQSVKIFPASSFTVTLSVPVIDEIFNKFVFSPAPTV